MLIKLQNQKTISSEKIVSIKNVDNTWCVKLNNGEVELADGEYEWLMTTVGNLVQITPTLSVSIEGIVMFEPNQNGYLIGWEGEPPIEITQEKGQLLIDFLSEYKQYLVLSDRIAFLQENQIQPEYNQI